MPLTEHLVAHAAPQDVAGIADGFVPFRHRRLLCKSLYGFIQSQLVHRIGCHNENGELDEYTLDFCALTVSLMGHFYFLVKVLSNDLLAWRAVGVSMLKRFNSTNLWIFIFCVKIRSLFSQMTNCKNARSDNKNNLLIFMIKG